jgi:hypothetical protein
MKYIVYANSKWHSEHPGLISACAIARSDAMRLGTPFDVERDGVKVATYRTERGKFVAWMR